MNAIVDGFKELGFKPGGSLYFRPVIALRIVAALESAKVGILGLDAVRMGKDFTQPSMEDSIDFSDSEEGNWEEARSFLESKMKSEFLFEIITAPS